MKAIEQETGCKMQTPKDFERLAEKVEKRTKEHLSESTLMRLWGYRPGVTTRQSTLDILSRYLGYADYVTFNSWSPDGTEEVQSDEVIANHLRMEQLHAGDRILLTWYPDRSCSVMLREDGLFEVMEACQTKLSVGDTFRCSIFIEGEPLYMSQLVHEGRSPMVFVAGKVNGIKFTYLPIDEDAGTTDCSA